MRHGGHHYGSGENQWSASNHEAIVSWDGNESARYTTNLNTEHIQPGIAHRSPGSYNHGGGSRYPSAHRDLYFGSPVGDKTFPLPIRTGRFPSYTVSRVALMVPFFRSNPTI